MIDECRKRQPLLFYAAAGNVALLAVCCVLALIDDTQITGINRWIKPIKFTSSVAICLATLAWYWPLAIASESAKTRAARILAGTMAFEIVIILIQAARGVRSHFNISTPMDGMLFQLMGVAILINIVTAATVGRWTFRAAPSPYVWAVRLGFVLFVVFSLEGGIMAQRLAHAVGAPDSGPGLPFLNWSRQGGDLRVAHFVGMHALQGIPLLGYFSRSTPAVAIAFALWSAISLAALWHALAGMPLTNG